MGVIWDGGMRVYVGQQSAVDQIRDGSNCLVTSSGGEARIVSARCLSLVQPSRSGLNAREVACSVPRDSMAINAKSLSTME